VSDTLNIRHTKDSFSTRAVVDEYVAHASDIGLWQSEALIFEKYVPKSSRILDVGCGAGRTTLALFRRGYENIIGLDLSEEMVFAARSIAKNAQIPVEFLVGDACALPFVENSFDTVFFSFNGLMTIPEVQVRQKAIDDIYRVLKPGGRFIFTTHDMDNPDFVEYWTAERERWTKGLQDSRLLEFGDLLFSKPETYGETMQFVHVPTVSEVEGCVLKSGFSLLYAALRQDICSESAGVLSVSVDVRFFVCEK